METTPLIWSSMDWFLYDNGLRQERVKEHFWEIAYRKEGIFLIENCSDVFKATHSVWKN